MDMMWRKGRGGSSIRSIIGHKLLEMVRLVNWNDSSNFGRYTAQHEAIAKRRYAVLNATFRSRSFAPGPRSKPCPHLSVYSLGLPQPSNVLT